MGNGLAEFESNVLPTVQIADSCGSRHPRDAVSEAPRVHWETGTRVQFCEGAARLVTQPASYGAAAAAACGTSASGRGGGCAGSEQQELRQHGVLVIWFPCWRGMRPCELPVFSRRRV